MSLFYDKRLWSPGNSTDPSSTFSAPSSTPTVNPDYEYLGCSTEGIGGRALTGGFLYSKAMTPQMCQTHCTSLGLLLSGTEYSMECYCGAALANGAVLGSSSCNMQCAGDANQICGGSNALSIFKHTPGGSSNSSVSTTATPTDPSVSSSTVSFSATATPSTDFEYLGCSTEGTDGRALTGGFLYSETMTPEVCQTYCKSLALPLAGVEYSKECYCGAALSNGATLGSPNCNMACGGDASKICGGPSALSLYRYAPAGGNSSVSSVTPTPTTPSQSSSSSAVPTSIDWKYRGCAFEGTGGRALTGGFLFLDTMTPHKCQVYCKSLNLKFSGVEYSKECYCGAALENGATLGSSKCNLQCGGDSTQICGGPSALSLYEYVPAGSNSSTGPVTSSEVPPTTPPSSTLPVTSSTTLTNGTSATPTPSTYEYIGCAREPIGDRALTLSSFTSSVLTPQLCQQHCSSLQLPLSGLEYGSECYCGMALSGNATLGSASCTVPCAGDNTKLCGGLGALSVYNWTSWAPEPQLTGWADLGCWKEGEGERALQGASRVFRNMTAGACVEWCGSNGWKVAGAEYGTECYCGNTMATTAVKVNEKDCGMLCAGGGGICGGLSRLSVYGKEDGVV
jgi:hypothetical protein